jgi:hypothetical protein
MNRITDCTLLTQGIISRFLTLGLHRILTPHSTPSHRWIAVIVSLLTWWDCALFPGRIIRHLMSLEILIQVLLAPKRRIYEGRPAWVQAVVRRASDSYRSYEDHTRYMSLLISAAPKNLVLMTEN